ncbi:MAG: MFS transporter [Holosporaceae bacterium]|nr:MFS transporter [Holosporaceae bacterium]
MMWSIVVVLFVYQFIARSSFPTVLTEQLMQHFSIDTAGMGVLASCYYWVYMFMQVPAGVVIDKISARIVAVVCAATCASGVYIFISTQNCYVAGIGWMILGFGSSFAFLLNLKIIANWFSADQIPIKTSHTIAVGCAGPVVGGPLVSYLVRDRSWVSVMEVFAIFGFFLTILVWVVIRDKEKSSDAVDNQEDVSITRSLKMIVTSRQIWILSLSTMMLYAPLSALGDLWGVLFMKKAYGVDSVVASLANNMLYVGMVIGAPVFAHLAVSMGSYKKPMVAGMVLATLSMGTIVLFCSQLSIEVVFFLFFLTGFSEGAMLAYPLALMMFPRSIGGTVSGFVNMISMLSGVILMPLIGWIVNWSWDGTIENGTKVYSVNDFRLGLLAVLIFLIIGVLLSLLIEDRSPKEKTDPPA